MTTSVLTSERTNLLQAVFQPKHSKWFAVAMLLATVVATAIAIYYGSRVWCSGDSWVKNISHLMSSTPFDISVGVGCFAGCMGLAITYFLFQNVPVPAHKSYTLERVIGDNNSPQTPVLIPGGPATICEDEFRTETDYELTKGYAHTPSQQKLLEMTPLRQIEIGAKVSACLVTLDQGTYQSDLGWISKMYKNCLKNGGKKRFEQDIFPKMLSMVQENLNKELKKPSLLSPPDEREPISSNFYSGEPSNFYSGRIVKSLASTFIKQNRTLIDEVFFDKNHYVIFEILFIEILTELAAGKEIEEFHPKFYAESDRVVFWA